MTRFSPPSPENTEEGLYKGMKTFSEWMMSKDDLLQWAPNKKYFTISPEWNIFPYYFPEQPVPSDAELQMMADGITSHGFPTKVSKTGEQWIYEDRPDFYPPEELLEKWHIAVDDAVDTLKKYRKVVGKKISHGQHTGGGQKMPFYNDDIERIWMDVKAVKDNPDMVKKIFDGLEKTMKYVLVHDAGLFNADGTLAPLASQLLRSY
jgi:hypothetical protein